MTPISFLFLTILVTLIGYTLQWTGEVIHRRKLRALAQAWELHFSPRDQFNLVRHVAEIRQMLADRAAGAVVDITPNHGQAA